MNIEYKIAKEGFVNISVVNVLGEKEIEVINKFMEKGDYYSKINLSSIQTGIYTCRMYLVDKEVIIKKLIISR